MTQRRVILDLGCGRRKHPGAIGVDNVALDSVDVVHDLLQTPYPFVSNCADEIILSHVLEHFTLDEINRILGEAHRILKPEGFITISVPHALSVAFSTDPTHTTRFTFATWFYFTENHRFQYYKKLNARWTVRRIWASVNLFNDHLVEPAAWQHRLERFVSRIMRYLVLRSRTMTLPDLLVKQFPFWLVSIHCQLAKAPEASHQTKQ